MPIIELIETYFPDADYETVNQMIDMLAEYKDILLDRVTFFIEEQL